MDVSIITIFVLCDEYLQASKHKEDVQCKVSDAEVMTTAITSALFFQGNFEKTSSLLKMSGMIPIRLSRSQFNRRVHRVKPHFVMLFEILGQAFKFVQQIHRKRIETAGSLLHRMIPKQIHAVTSKGFELKLFLFVLAYSIADLYHTT